MKKQIEENINNPEKLECLYRENKKEFINVFKEITEGNNSELVKFWKIRLASDTQFVIKDFLLIDLLIVILLSLLTGFLAKLPAIFPQISLEFFYTRNLAIIVFNGIILYTFWQNRMANLKIISIYGLIIFVITLFINFLPNNEGDSIMLALLFTPLFLWCVFGLSLISFEHNNTEKKIEFIRFNGELLIMTGLILIAGGMLTGITIGLFSVININIEKFYLEYIAIIGGVSAPIVSYYLIRLYPSLTNKIAPVIARVFTPLVLITLVVYLLSFISSTSNISEDRELLLLFNIMLIAVLAIIVFSVTELDKLKKMNKNVLVLFLLASVAIIINIIALTAIFSRVLNGLTPNRTVVLVSNILIFINLILIAKNLFQAYFRQESLELVEETVAKYLTIYAAWTVVVIFILPLVFGLK